MLTELVFGSLFIAMTAPVVFPEETKAIGEAWELTKKQMAASARSTNRPLIKGYRTQDEARRHRIDLAAGEIIYFPNGAQITTDVGLKDTQMDGWWYAWNAEEVT